jgi:AcrR family transcriptional regulator
VSVTVQSGERVRAPLSREQVLAGAVRYVDEHGLDALSMHKLGAALGVRGMSLYKHVANKDDLLDGIVERLWAEIPTEPVADNWRDAIHHLGAALRDLVHRHPHAAPLLTSRQTIHERSLLVCEAQLRVMREAGVPEQCAVALLRTVLVYGIGHGLAELAMPDLTDQGTEDEVTRVRRVTNLLTPQASDDLVRTAMLVCGDYDMTDQFDIGLDLMIRGLDAYLDTLGASGPNHRAG